MQKYLSFCCILCGYDVRIGMASDPAIDTLRRQLSEIEGLLRRHQNVTEIMANEDGSIWVEAQGRVFRERDGISRERRESIIRMLAGHHKVICNSSNPTLSVKMPVFGGGRFQGLVPPVTTDPCFSLRMPPRTVMSLTDLLESGTISGRQLEALEDAVNSHRNIIVAGGTGSGKTTIANALLQLVTKDRLVVIEDNPELIPASSNRVMMLTSESFTLRAAVKASLRLRPDRIIVGEIRDGGTALDLIKAWLTGHPGGIATIHSDSAEGTKRRLRALMQEVVVTPSDADINAAVDLVVYVSKRRKNREIRRHVEEILTRDKRSL